MLVHNEDQEFVCLQKSVIYASPADAPDATPPAILPAILSFPRALMTSFKDGINVESKIIAYSRTGAANAGAATAAATIREVVIWTMVMICSVSWVVGCISFLFGLYRGRVQR